MSVSFENEFEYLVHLIKCTLKNDKPQELPDGLSFDLVYKYAYAHSVANTAFYSVERLKNPPQSPLYEEWRETRDMCISRDINQSFARDEIVSEFERQGIRCLEAQGSVIKNMYPQSDFRTMSDLDFIVDLDNLKKAWKAIEPLGYKYLYEKNGEISAERQPNIHIEIHTVFFPSWYKYYGILPEPFDGADNIGGLSYRPSVDNLYLYSMLHIAKHYFGGGCGIRRIMDVYILKNIIDDVDMEYIKNRVNNDELIVFFNDLHKLADVWFENGKLTPELEQMQNYIFKSGTHGTAHHALSHKFAAKKNNGEHFVKLKELFGRIFVDKLTMTHQYPILLKHPHLMFFCRILRIFRLIFKEPKKVILKIKQIKNADTNIK